MTTLKYKLEGLDCEHCAARLERKLAALEGIEEAQVLYPDCICVLKTDKEESEMTININTLRTYFTFKKQCRIPHGHPDEL